MDGAPKRRTSNWGVFASGLLVLGVVERKRLQLGQQRQALAGKAKLLLLELRKRAGSLAAQLHQLSPQAVLDRGYAIAFDAAGNVLKSAEAVELNDRIGVQLARGRLEADVKKKGP